MINHTDVGAIIQMVRDMCAESDIRARIRLALMDAYAAGCEDTEKELEE